VWFRDARRFRSRGSTPSAHPNLPATAGLDGFEYRTVAEAGLEYESAEASRIGWGFISLYTLAFISTSLLFLAPLLVTTVALAPSIPVVLVGWCIAQLLFNALLAALVAVLPDQVPPAQRGQVAGVLGVCVRSRR
jgi:MFS family permease